MRKDKMSDSLKDLRGLSVQKKCKGVMCKNKVLIGDLYCSDCIKSEGLEGKERKGNKERHKVYNKFKRDKVRDRFYQSTEWKKKREEIRKRDKYRCQRCERRGIFKKGDVVHHIKELRDYPELKLEDSNLEMLCHKCHNDIHGGITWGRQ